MIYSAINYESLHIDYHREHHKICNLSKDKYKYVISESVDVLRGSKIKIRFFFT